uniref:SCP domain-containing protein n=1 Tax=Strongyloides papillosus TaxID=174720 RepID=A0A0N5BB19_STREA
MNFLLIIVLHIIVIFNITSVPIKANPHDSDDEKEPLIDRENSVRKYSNRRSSQLSYRRLGRISHRKPSVRRPSLNYESCKLNIKSYLGGKKIYISLQTTVWHDFNYKYYWKNNYEEYKSRVIQNINLLRMIYSVCPLKESTKLDISAQTYAKLIAEKPLTLNPFKQYGVITTVLYNSELVQIVSRIYNEHIFYNYYFNSGGGLTNRFTQLVWKSSAYIGIGVSNREHLVYIVLLFYPKGNIRGRYERNVLKKKISWKKAIYAE